MDHFLSQTYYGNTLQSWLFSIAIILLSIRIAKVIYWLFLNIFHQIAAKTHTRLDDLIIQTIEKPFITAVVIFNVWLGLYILVLPTGVDKAIDEITEAIILLLVTWVLVRLLDVLVDQYIKPLVASSESALDDQLLPLIQKFSKIFIWGVALILCLKNAGYDVGALLAGLGIGGIALAMAAKDTIANVFGGFTIFADRPFQINDRIKAVGYDGTVVDIGIRSTRLRTLEGRLVTIPNATFAESPVENVTREPSRKVVLELGLVYDTPPKQMEQALAILRDIVDNHHKSLEKEIILYFSNFAASSLNITFAYYIRKDADIALSQNEVNLAILNRFNDAGLSFAFPTRTVYTIAAQKA